MVHGTAVSCRCGRGRPPRRRRAADLRLLAPAPDLSKHLRRPTAAPHPWSMGPRSVVAVVEGGRHAAGRPLTSASSLPPQTFPRAVRPRPQPRPPDSRDCGWLLLWPGATALTARNRTRQAMYVLAMKYPVPTKYTTPCTLPSPNTYLEGGIFGGCRRTRRTYANSARKGTQGEWGSEWKGQGEGRGHPCSMGLYPCVGVDVYVE